MTVPAPSAEETQMPHLPLTICLPIEDRRASFAFYTDGLGLEAVGEPADDGVPEPLRIVLADAVHLMLIPRGGFDWVTGDHTVSERGNSECLLSLSAGTAAAVDDLVSRAEAAGGRVVSPPAAQPWGYTGTVADPDGHLWSVLTEA